MLFALLYVGAVYLAAQLASRHARRVVALRSLGHLASPEPKRLAAPRPVLTPDDPLVRRLTWGDLERVAAHPVCVPSLGHHVDPCRCT